MYMIFVDTRKNRMKQEKGSALIIAVIVLTILGILGLAALDIADLNLFMAANDRESKASFFRADSGANIGREFIMKAFDEGNSTFYESNANEWQNATFNATEPGLLKYHIYNDQATYIKAGLLEINAKGTGLIIGAGYEGFGKGLAHGAEFHYLIRSHRTGARNSEAEVDLGFRDVDN